MRAHDAHADQDVVAILMLIADLAGTGCAQTEAMRPCQMTMMGEHVQMMVARTAGWRWLPTLSSASCT
jgi:hypothetical protein